MAIDTPARHIYSGDGSTRVFPIPTYIQGDDYIRIEINGVHQIDRSKWDIVNNSIIFVTAPITTATIDVQVATSVEALSELGNVTNVDIVAGNIASINGIASNLDEILEADNNAVIATTKANEASASALIATTKAGEALASSTSALASATIATNKASEASISATTAITKASEASNSASTATTKASEALSSATSASSSAITASSGATIATTKASEASTSASNALTSENKAKKWADESEDVPVESGLYSAKHWASKAAEIVGAGLIDDVTPSTYTVFSSTRSNNTYEPKNSNIQGHISNNTTNPHNVTKSQIGLSNVDNTSDANKPISNATSTALNSKQDTLVSGTNIKTINGSSVLGRGDVVVGGINLSNITAYHLLQGNLSATVSANYVEVSSTTTRNYTTSDYIFDITNYKLYDCIMASTVGTLLTNTTYFTSITAGTLNINNALIPLAQGIDSNGAKNTIISKNETITGLAYTAGKNYVYCDKNGSYGVKNVAPNYGKTNPANGGDFYNVVTNKWYTSAGVEITNSRNYLNHIVYADNDGGVLYVEELPKIEYKDIVKANEFKGKNACTAWVNFDGTTTPPTIKDSYNVSAVIRTSAGVYDIYFKESMDNVNYNTIITSNFGSNDCSHIVPRTLNKVTVATYVSTSGSNASYTYNNVHIDGGKN